MDEMSDTDHPTGGADLPTTGDRDVDAVLAGLAELDDLPLRAHVAAFETVHRGLQERLAESDRADR